MNVKKSPDAAPGIEETVREVEVCDTTVADPTGDHPGSITSTTSTPSLTPMVLKFTLPSTIVVLLVPEVAVKLLPFGHEQLAVLPACCFHQLQTVRVASWNSGAIC